MALSKRQRFRILQRDNFQCRYCGQSAPNVQLQVDHVNPVSNGGHDDDDNLVTSCQPCNSGKSDTLLMSHETVHEFVNNAVFDIGVSLALIRYWKRKIGMFCADIHGCDERVMAIQLNVSFGCYNPKMLKQLMDVSIRYAAKDWDKNHHKPKYNYSRYWRILVMLTLILAEKHIRDQFYDVVDAISDNADF